MAGLDPAIQTPKVAVWLPGHGLARRAAYRHVATTPGLEPHERRLCLHPVEQARRHVYIGVTSNLSRRIWEHREGTVDGFSKRYGLKRLVNYEPHDDIRNTLQREKNMKHWPRAWKLALIHEMNPDWEDLYERLNS